MHVSRMGQTTAMGRSCGEGWKRYVGVLLAVLQIAIFVLLPSDVGSGRLLLESAVSPPDRGDVIYRRRPGLSSTSGSSPSSPPPPPPPPPPSPHTDSTAIASSTIGDYTATIDEKLVGLLPGLYRNETPSPHYAGYIHLRPKPKPGGDRSNNSMIDGDVETKSLFYYFVESERSPATDPVVLWLNGGPGCSSMLGFALENGPFRFEKAPTTSTSHLPTLSINPFAWSKVANMIYLDSPYGVGLSLGPLKAEHWTSDDWRTSADLHAFLLAWVEAHPDFSNNPLYLSGESYAGVYIPMLAMSIVEGVESQLQPLLNLKGYMIGNGVVDAKSRVFERYGAVEVAHGLSLIDEEMYSWVTTVCGSREAMADIWRAPEACRNATVAYGSSFRLHARLQMIDVFNTLRSCDTPLDDSLTDASQTLCQVYQQLQSNTITPWEAIGLLGPDQDQDQHHQHQHQHQHQPEASNHSQDQGQHQHHQHHQHQHQHQPEASNHTTDVGGGGEEELPRQTFKLMCTDFDWLGSWFDDAEVRRAINVRPVEEVGDWQACAEHAGRFYSKNGGDMVRLHGLLTSQHGLRVLIYSGDHDLQVPTPGTEAWLRYLGYGEAYPGSLLRHRWTVEGEGEEKTGGFRKLYEKNLTFATVMGAGHTVSADKPAAALQLFRSWLDKSDDFPY